RGPALLAGEVGKGLLARPPEIGVTAQGGDLARRDAGEPPGPVLGIQQDLGHSLEVGAAEALQKKQLSSEIQTQRQSRRERLIERVTARFVFVADRFELGIFVVRSPDDLTPGIQQDGGSAVRHGYDGLNPLFARGTAEGRDQPVPYSG